MTPRHFSDSKSGEIDISEQKPAKTRNKVIFCVNERPPFGQPSCARRGSRELMVETNKFVRDAGIDITIDTSVCMGRCADGPTVKLAPRGEFVQDANPENIREAIMRYLASD